MGIARVRTAAAIGTSDVDLCTSMRSAMPISSIRTRMDVERERGAW